MPEQKKDKRRYRRVKKTLHVQCHLHNTTEPWSSAIVQDIGEAGISIATKERFAADEVLEIRITTLLRRQRPISVLGKVVGCREKKTGGTNWIEHIAFVSVLEEDKPILKEIIQAFLEASQKEQAK
jgi:hypothetical protein